MTVIRILTAWFLFGAIAAVFVYGVPLLRIVLLGPVSLLQTFVA